MLHAQEAPSFLDAAHEWRRLFAEAWGTFLLVLAAAGAGAVRDQGGAVTPAMAATAPGLMVMALIYGMGSVSGAHLNPVVTLAFAARGNFPWRRVPGYILAQFLGAVGAAAFLRLALGAAGTLGATVPGPGVGILVALAFEVVLTAGLVHVILGTAAGARNIGANAALAVGGYVALAGLWAGPISGASMNPARSLAPDLIRGDFRAAWIYVVGPLIGGLIGVGIERILKGTAGAAGAQAAQGTLSEPR
ncbi:MAG: hypothetical protein HKL90_02245 [Elusimicrobia bacterium]|nr:hypothetical protein [Elusimicrobiota bacterium]